jgi:hypothetical protein
MMLWVGRKMSTKHGRPSCSNPSCPPGNHYSGHAGISLWQGRCESVRWGFQRPGWRQLLQPGHLLFTSFLCNCILCSQKTLTFPSKPQPRSLPAPNWKRPKHETFPQGRRGKETLAPPEWQWTRRPVDGTGSLCQPVTSLRDLITSPTGCFSQYSHDHIIPWPGKACPQKDLSSPPWPLRPCWTRVQLTLLAVFCFFFF